ncbi:hypothetical protein [Catellatospora paridis]|uniref:hypothetical protein n=1 Tax=Catellatospora paridis TaxID=1617086 RepID=UPI0012D4B89A|nr:hypothetical protein [Catellatospora paridis]
MRTALHEPDTDRQDPAAEPAPAAPADAPTGVPDPATEVAQALRLLDTAAGQARDLLHENAAVLPKAMLATARTLLATAAHLVRNLDGWVLDMARPTHNDVAQVLASTCDAIRHTGAAQALVELAHPDDRV